MDTGQEHRLPKRSDLTTLRSTFESVVKAHYAAIQGHLAFRLVACPPICSDTINLLARYVNEFLSVACMVVVAKGLTVRWIS